MVTIYLKRVYDAAEADDGTRVLVDGIWPRGMRKADTNIDMWMKDVASSRNLRQWFKHDPARWDAFAEAYQRELAAKPDALAPLFDLLDQGPVTLLFAARDRDRNNAVCAIASAAYLNRPVFTDDDIGRHHRRRPHHLAARTTRPSLHSKVMARRAATLIIGELAPSVLSRNSELRRQFSDRERVLAIRLSIRRL